MTRVFGFLAGTMLVAASAQLPPPNVVENGDARSGDASWGRYKAHRPITGAEAKAATVEHCDSGPCFVMRNGTAWRQRIHMTEDVGGKFVLIIARGSSERVHADGNITGLPYLWARLITDPPMLPGTVLQGMALDTTAPSRWGTMHGVFPVPKNVVAMDVMLGQAERRGTPQNGSAARVKDVEVRFFDTEAAARAYVKIYNALHDPHVDGL